MSDIYRLGFLGCGEAGQAMCHSLFQLHGQISSGFDIADVCQGASTSAQQPNVLQRLSHREQLATDCEVIISVVTADDAAVAAEQMMPYLSKRHIFVDANSVSPQTKQAIALKINASGALYIDMAIMAPIHPKGHQTPVLVAGSDRSRLIPVLDALGFDYDWRSEKIGDASMVKMLRSILIKGMESLICECVTAAQEQGLDTEILSSAGRTLGIDDMPGLADYVMERVAHHGRRRAAELREVAKTLEELGLSNYLPVAIAQHQDMVADFNLAEKFQQAIPQRRAVLAPAMRAAQKQ